MNNFAHFEAKLPAEQMQPFWLPLLILSGSVILLLGLYWPTTLSIGSAWLRSDTYAHGFLIVPIVLYIFWQQRQRLLRLKVHSWYWGLALLLLLCAIWLIGNSADVLVVQQMALVAMIPVLFLTVLGKHAFWAFAFPLAYLFFAVPIGEGLVPTLQHITAVFTVKALQLSGIPVLLEGFHITIPSKDDPLGWDKFLVAEACSGSRYLLASVALGCLFAYLTYRSFWRRLAFISLAIILPIIANGIRAYGIVMIAHLSNMKYAIGIDHLIYGWIFFGFIILLMFWIGSKWREPVATTKQSSVSLTQMLPYASNSSNYFLLIAAASALLTTLTGPLGAHWLNSTSNLNSAPLIAPPAPFGWQKPQVGTAHWQPYFMGTDNTLAVTYLTDSGHSVYLYIAYYPREYQGAELINSGNYLFNDERWQYISNQQHVFQNSKINATRIRAHHKQRVIWHWYRVAGVDTASPIVAKLLRAWDQLSGLHQGSAIIALATDYDDVRYDQAQALLEQFAEVLLPQLNALLNQ